MNWRAMAALVCGLLLAAPQGRAAEYPTRAIKLIVPYPAGGPTDVLARMVGEYLSRDLKQPVVVENKAGAQGAIGADTRQAADDLCNRIRRAGGACFVLRNMSVRG